MCSHVTSQECDQRTDRQTILENLTKGPRLCCESAELREGSGCVSLMSPARNSYRVAKVRPELHLRKWCWATRATSMFTTKFCSEHLSTITQHLRTTRTHKHIRVHAIYPPAIPNLNQTYVRLGAIRDFSKVTGLPWSDMGHEGLV